MPQKLGPCRDATSERTEREMLSDMLADGEPHYFASSQEVSRGDEFTIAGQPFVVTRILTRAQFVERMHQLRRRAHVADPELRSFFEAATD